MKNILNKGILITIEGIDGCGKSSLCKSLFENLSKKYNCILTKEPGGSELGKSLREILQNKKVCTLSEYLLFAADRAQHFNELVIPELQENKIVISDRMADSSLAYQGYARGLDINFIEQINNLTMQSIKPDLTLYLEVDLETAQKRINSRNLKLTVMEQEKVDFMEKVKNAFDTIFKNRNNVNIIDATQVPEKVLIDSVNAVEKWIQQNKI